ncbi:hypothetical protein [Ktedonospora formicarum]|uniref:Uncharacterized protein n=1 Tax=Ktedonospora formicarum TaxID=2778364 RepID=A0A8J3HVP2_9CHLR|nr:hypothetical protein [Ktedonospora formicarum]GHO41850.1 hypothetical protein KSX_00130 [Ktedonospora formicarum]
MAYRYLHGRRSAFSLGPTQQLSIAHLEHMAALLEASASRCLSESGSASHAPQQMQLSCNAEIGTVEVGMAEFSIGEIWLDLGMVSSPAIPVTYALFEVSQMLFLRHWCTPYPCLFMNIDARASLF